MANEYVQRWADGDDNTAGGFLFDDDDAGKDIGVSKIVFGADGAAITRVSGGNGTAATALRVTLASDSTGVLAATQSGTWNIANISGTISLPTGAATSAKQDTAAAILTTMDADTGAIATSVASLDTKAPALGQALAAASVPVVLPAAQIATLTPPAAITGFATAVNQATIIASLASIDGHVDGVEGALTSIDAKITAVNTGAVVIASSALPTGAATAARQDTGNASLAAIEADVETVKDTLTQIESNTLLAAGSLTTLDDAVSGTGFNISQLGGVNVTMGNGPSGTGVQRVTIANDSTGIMALTTSTATIGKLGSNSGVTIGAVEIASAQAITIAAGSNQIGKLAANSGVDIGDVDVTSLPGAAHDAAVSGNPVRIGLRAESGLSGITLVADGDTTDAYGGLDGVQITRPHCNLEDIVSGCVGITDGSSTSVIASAGAGVKIYITSIIISNSSATPVTVDIRDGAAGTVKATLPVPADVAGVVTNFPVPLPFSAATAVCADPSAAASTVTVTLIGFKSKV